MNHVSGIREFIIENFLYGEDADLDDDVHFYESGIVDSTGMLEIVAFVENTYNITVHDDEVIPENFSSVNAINQYLQKKLNRK